MACAFPFWLKDARTRRFPTAGHRDPPPEPEAARKIVSPVCRFRAPAFDFRLQKRPGPVESGPPDWVEREFSMRFVILVKATARSGTRGRRAQDLMATITENHEQLAKIPKLYEPEDFALTPRRRAASGPQVWQ
jgi:hypothetical protein